MLRLVPGINIKVNNLGVKNQKFKILKYQGKRGRINKPIPYQKILPVFMKHKLPRTDTDFIRETMLRDLVEGAEWINLVAACKDFVLDYGEEEFHEIIIEMINAYGNLNGGMKCLHIIHDLDIRPPYRVVEAVLDTITMDTDVDVLSDVVLYLVRNNWHPDFYTFASILRNLNLAEPWRSQDVVSHFLGIYLDHYNEVDWPETMFLDVASRLLFEKHFEALLLLTSFMCERKAIIPNEYVYFLRRCTMRVHNPSMLIYFYELMRMCQGAVHPIVDSPLYDHFQFVFKKEDTAYKYHLYTNAAPSLVKYILKTRSKEGKRTTSDDLRKICSAAQLPTRYSYEKYNIMGYVMEEKEEYDSGDMLVDPYAIGKMLNARAKVKNVEPNERGNVMNARGSVMNARVNADFNFEVDVDGENE